MVHLIPDHGHPCDQCQNTAGTKVCSGAHAQRQHGGQYVAAFLHLNLFHLRFQARKEREDLKNHVEVVHRDGNYHNCVMCGFKSAMREDLGSHMETVHKGIYSEGSIY